MPPGVAVTQVPARPWLSVAESLQHRYHPWRYASLMQRDRPAVLLAHFGDEGCRMVPVASRWQVPLLTRFYGYDMSQLPRRGRWLARLQWLFTEGAGILVEGPAMASAVADLGCPPARIHILPLGIACAAIPWQPRGDDGTGPVRVLMAATLREKKGHTFGLSALAQLAARHPRLQVTVIGDGPLRRPLQDQVDASPLAGRVTWLGNVPHAQVLAAMAEHHLFLHPSVTAGDGDSEGGAPIVLLEAQASGMPVISSIHADIPHIVRPGLSGLLAPEQDVPALVSALSYLLERPERWAAMGEAGRRHVETHFDAPELGERLADLVETVVTGWAEPREPAPAPPTTADTPGGVS